MGNHEDNPFDSIESAQEFMALLSASIEDARNGVAEDREQAESEHDGRRVEALDLALYKLKLLDAHVHKSSRILNDLRSIRRLLSSERVSNVG